jgi:hypothetical protein
MPGTNTVLLAGNTVNGIGSGVGQSLATKTLETLLGNVQLSKPAQDAIMSMQQHFFANNPSYDFITPLRRTGFYLGKAPYKKSETIAYLAGKIENNQHRLAVLTNMNLKEAALLLWDLHCQISLHIMHRRDSTFERSDADHSFVLMYLQESIAVAFEYICNKPNMPDEEVLELKTKIMAGIVEPFHAYIQQTQSSQSSGARRTALDHNVRETMEKVVRAMERFTTEKPLRTSIEALQQTAQRFNIILKQMLLAMILVTREEGGAKQDVKWVLHRKMILAKAVQSEYEDMIACLQEENVTSTGYQKKEGILYANPFAKRVMELNASPVVNQDMCYFQYIMQVFSLVERSQNEQSQQELEQLAEDFTFNYSHLQNSTTFLLKDVLREESREIEFLSIAVLLYRQSYELARFMSALQHFMQLVGKLGLYNNQTLHAQLTNLIQAASTCLDYHLMRMQSSLKQGSEALVGGWLNPIDEMLQQLRRQGLTITQEMQSFQGHFAKIIDPVAMQKEFKKSKIELLQAALGLGHASQIDREHMDAIIQQIGKIDFDQFASLPTKDIDTSARMSELLNFTEEMGHRLESAESEVAEIRLTYQGTRDELDRIRSEMTIHERELRDNGERLQANASALNEHVESAEAKLIDIDHLVESFGADIKQQLNSLNSDSLKDVEEANRLLEIARSNLTSSSHILTEHMADLSKLKGRLEERQSSYKKLVESMTAFQIAYQAQRGAVGLSLVNIQEVAQDIDKTILELMAKINALSDLISTLRTVLVDKDKKLAEQHARILKLEDQLTTLSKEKNTAASAADQAHLPRTNAADSNSGHSSTRILPNISFIQPQGANPPLTPRDRIQSIMDDYEFAITQKRFVRNRARKVIKYAIWCELNNIVFEKGSVDGSLHEPKDLVMAAIRKIKTNNFSINRQDDIYSFNSIISGKDDNEIYQEFFRNGKDTNKVLNELRPTFMQYLAQRNELTYSLPMMRVGQDINQ